MAETCAKCVLSINDDPSIKIFDDGVCNYCHEYEHHNDVFFLDEGERKKKLELLVQNIKKEGKNKPFDCILGISGGVDSSYLVVKAVELGLRPLVVHYDNGWNSEQAVNNIEQLVQKLGVDLYTYVNDWEEFKDIQLSFFKASVLDIELTTDHAILAVLYQQARKHGIYYVLQGTNYATESHLPVGWYHWKNDALNIKAIHRRFGEVKMKTFPYMNFVERVRNDKYGHVKFLGMLDYLSYNKENAKADLIANYGWKDYGGKHFESVFTRFYQGYYLVKKFGVDKRKAHLSSLICSGQLSRDEAIEILKSNSYLDNQAEEDKLYVIKKLGLTEGEFDTIMAQPPKSHFDYPSYITRHYKVLSFFTGILRPFRKKKS